MASGSIRLCSACCATLDLYGSSQAVPSYSEKPDPPPVTFGCGHSVCGACVRKRRSLARSCIVCTGVSDILGDPQGSTSLKTADETAHSLPPGYDLSNGSAATDFVLGDDDDDDDDVDTGVNLDASRLANSANDAAGTAQDDELPPQYDENGDPVGPAGGKEKGEDKRSQPQLHYLQPDDTLLGLSMRYGVDGRALCRQNNLPTSTLSTTPQLLHTRQFILLPPGARPSTSSEPLLPPAMEKRRLIVRRFQTQTKCTDWAMATAYVDQVFDAREKEANLIRENRRVRDDTEEVEPREGGELKEAVEAYLADERWEREQRNSKGKGRGLFSRPIDVR